LYENIGETIEVAAKAMDSDAIKKYVDELSTYIESVGVIYE